MNRTEEAVERRVGPLEHAVLGLAETTDRTSRVESDLAGLRAAMADGSAKVEEVPGEVAGWKAQLSHCCPKVNQDLTNLARELAALKEEMRELRLQKAAMADERQRHGQEIRDVKHEVELLRKASDSQQKSQERETQAAADVRKVVGQLAGDPAIRKRSRSVKSRGKCSSERAAAGGCRSTEGTDRGAGTGGSADCRGE
jgi:chromosome segregation ATPase